MSHVTDMNESCHRYEWVMSQIWMSHVTDMNESCHRYEWDMSQIWMSHVADMNESCYRYYACNMKLSCQALACLRKAHDTHMKAIWMLPTAPYYNIYVYIHERIWNNYVRRSCVSARLMSHIWMQYGCFLRLPPIIHMPIYTRMHMK